MRVAFLTGGTGFVGGHVARALSEQGWKVRLLARDPRRAASHPLLEGLDIEVVGGHLADEAGLSRAVAGAEAIVHVAGVTKARTLEEYREVNVRGTERLLRAAAGAAKGAHFLLVSSQAAAGPARGGRPVGHADPAQPISWYGLSKREGEEAVSRLWNSGWTVLRPGVIFGPGDRGLFAFFKMVATGWLPIPAASTRVQLIGAERAALAIARSAGKKELAAQIRFLCDSEPVTLRQLAEAIARTSGLRARTIRVPDVLVRLLGGAETALETLTRRSRPFNADKAREILAGDWLCEGASLARELSLPAPVSLEEGLRGAWEWYRRAGWLPGAPGAAL